MSLYNFTPDAFSLTINGRTITDFGEADQPFTHSPMNNKFAIKKGRGGNGCRTGMINPGEQATLNLLPGSPDSAYVNGLLRSGAVITLTATQIGTLETAIGTEGTITTRGEKGRGGENISDDIYMFEFNVWDELAGGE